MNKDPKTSSEENFRDNESLTNDTPRLSKKKNRSVGMKKNLRQKIKDLETEIREFQLNENSKLYGLTSEVERAVKKAIEEENGPQLYRLIRPLHPADFADLIERHSADERRLLVTVVGKNFNAEILAELDETVREDILSYLSNEVLTDSFAELPNDDAVEVLGELDEDVQERLLNKIPEEERVLLKEGLAYEDETAGRLMQREIVTVPDYWTIGQTIDFLRSHGNLPEDFYDVIDLGGHDRSGIASSFC